MKFLLFIMIFSFPTWASGPLELSEEELNPSAEEVLIKKPEKYLRNESMMYDLNNDLGIKDQRQYTGQDRNRLSVAGHVSGDYEHVNEMLGLELAYMRRSTSYHQAWWGGQIFRHQAQFGNITQNPSSGGANSEASFSRPDDAKNDILGLGLGAGYRFKLLLDFFETEDVFESIDVFANVIELNESFIKEKYQGYGLTTNYGIHKRSSTSLFYGGKLSYNIASVSRNAIADESRSERSLSLGWLSVALELGMFF